MTTLRWHDGRLEGLPASGPRSSRAPRAALVAALALALGALGARVASAEGEAGVAPAPPPATSAPGKNLDELLAVVEGEMITRRILAREVGERGPDQDEREYEDRLRVALVRRAELRIYEKAAERMGLTLTPDTIEEITKEKAARMVRSAKDLAEKNKPGSGASITFDAILQEKGLSREEFKTETTKEEMRRRYFTVLIRGVPGKRAVVDTEPSPEDVRRLYAAHKSEFDQRLGARFAFWVVRPVDFLGEGSSLTWDQAKAQARAKAESLLRDFATDKDVQRTATASGVKLGDFGVVPVGQFRERGELPKPLDPVADWVYSDGRAAGEGTVVDTPRGDVFAVAILELRPARTRAFDEVQKDLLERINGVRIERFFHQHTLEILSHAQIWPSRLADVLEDREREQLRRLDADPVNRDIRLR